MNLNKIRQITPADRSLLLKCTHHLITPIARGLSLRLKNRLITLADRSLLRLKYNLITLADRSLLRLKYNLITLADRSLLQLKHRLINLTKSCFINEMQYREGIQHHHLITLTKTYLAMPIIRIIFFAFISHLLPQANATSPSSFIKAKNIMYQKVYFDNQKTFYCGCSYKDKVVNLNSCGYEVRNNTYRAKRIEAEHIVPAYWIANLTKKGRKCWSIGVKLPWTNPRQYCLKTNKAFKQAHNDLINLVPVIGEVNANRSNYRFAMIKAEVRNYGECDLEINNSGNKNSRAVEPAPNIRGDIARVYFYMADKYGLGLSHQTRQLMQSWNRFDPIDAWEQKRVNRIVAIQGT